MLAGQRYDCGDEELLTQWHRAKDLIRDYNRIDSANAQEKERILSELLGGKGENLWITAPFFVDYGNNIYFGDDCEVNMNCTFLDDNVIRIGNPCPDRAQCADLYSIFIRPTRPTALVRQAGGQMGRGRLTMAAGV